MHIISKLAQFMRYPWVGKDGWTVGVKGDPAPLTLALWVAMM